MKIQAFTLSGEEKIRLQNIEKYDDNWRIRERAKSLILLATGLTCKQIAKQLGLNFRTISSTRKHWNEEKFQSLPDRPRPGAPLKITQDEQANILQWVQAEPLSSQQVLAKHQDAGGTAVHVNTVVNFLRKNKFVWKRTRHSLKKKRNEPAFRQAQSDIALLHESAAAGEIILASLDEAGFSAIHPNRSAWTKIGLQHLIPAIRGKRLNVLAAMMSTGELESTQFTGSMTSDILIEFLNEISDKYTTPITFILDNASMHHSKKLKKHMIELEKKGIKLYFLPPYSPELNRIEKLWQQMKYVWMSAKCRTLEMLEADVGYILENFGQNFNLKF
jgi:transposase